GVQQDFDWFNGDEPEQVLLDTYLAAIGELVDEHGEDPNDWETAVPPLEVSHQNFIGVDQANEDEALTAPVHMNRGTQNNMIHLNGDKASMCVAAPPGQSAFVSPDGETAQHYDDQLDLYLSFECKNEHLTEESIADAAVSSLTINPTGEVALSEQERTSGLGSGWWWALGALVLLGAIAAIIIARRRS